MDIAIRPQSGSQISYKGDRQEKVSNGMAYGGGAGAATFATIRNSSRIGNSLTKAIKNSRMIKVEKQTQLIDLLTKTRFARFAKNPLVVKGAGLLAGMSAITSLIGSAAKISDTCNYLSSQNPAV